MRARTVGLLVCLCAWSMSTHGKPSSSGDEPHYLIVTHSLLTDGDLDLANNFAQDDGTYVGADGLTAGTHVRRTRQGRMYSAHDLGLPVLVLPAYAVGQAVGHRLAPETLARFRMTPGRFAYATVSLFLVVLTGAGAALLTAALRVLTTPGRAAAVAAVVSLTPPVLAYTFLVFPEAPAFTIVCFTLWVSLTTRASATPSFFRVCTMLTALGLLPWFHRKFSFMALALVVALCASAWPRLRTLTTRQVSIAIAVFVVPFGAFFLHSLVTWGSLGGPQLSGTSQFAIDGIATGAAGLLLDRSRGLLPYAPIYLIAPVAWWLSGATLRIWLLPVAALFLPMAAFVTWDAGYCPAARFLVPLMPLVALPVVLALSQPTFRRATVGLLVLQIAMAGYAWQNPRALWPGEVGDNRLLNALPVVGPSLNAVFPVINEGTWQ